MWPHLFISFVTSSKVDAKFFNNQKYYVISIAYLVFMRKCRSMPIVTTCLTKNSGQIVESLLNINIYDGYLGVFRVKDLLATAFLLFSDLEGEELFGFAFFVFGVLRELLVRPQMALVPKIPGKDRV